MGLTFEVDAQALKRLLAAHSRLVVHIGHIGCCLNLDNRFYREWRLGLNVDSTRAKTSPSEQFVDRFNQDKSATAGRASKSAWRKPVKQH